RPDALCADGEADDRRAKEDIRDRQDAADPLLRRAARRDLPNEERQADHARELARQGQGVRARQVVLRRGALPAEERWLRVLRPYQVSADRSALRRPAGLLR